MDKSNTADGREEVPRFPYQVLWAGYGNAKVTLRELEENAEEYRILNEEVPAGWQGVPRVALADVENLLSRHQLSQRMAKHLWLSCCFFISAAALGTCCTRSFFSDNTISAKAHFNDPPLPT